MKNIAQRFLPLAALVLLGGCCNATVKPFEVTVMFDEATYKSLVEPVEVDIVGVNNDAAMSYQKETIGPYFRPTPETSPAKRLRSQLSLGSDRITLRFIPSADGAAQRSVITPDTPVNAEVQVKTRMVTLSLDHPVWKTWLGERPSCSRKADWNLLVFADLREVNKDQPPKRISLTVKDWDEKAWKQRGLTIEIKGTHVLVNTVDAPPAR